MVDTSQLAQYQVDPSFAGVNPAANRQQTFAPVTMPTLPTTGDLTKYYQDAFSQLQPYYAQKLKEANGDLEEAKRRITYDYQTGMRYNTQDTQLAQERQNQDFQSAMQKLGVTFHGENVQQGDTLNKRGVALTQNSDGTLSAPTASSISYDANGNTVYTGNQGQAGNEVSMLAEDQRLRKEAETRAAQRNLQDIGIKGTRQATTLGETQGRSSFDTNRQFQQTGEQLGEQQQNQAYQLATGRQQQDIQAKQLQQQNDLYHAQIAAAKQQGIANQNQTGI